MNRYISLLAVALTLAGCATPTAEKRTVPATPSPGAPGAPVVRQPLPQMPLPLPSPDTARTAEPPLMPVIVPPGTVYVCVVDAAGQRQQTAIEFSPKVGELCRKHPEMGPCQYEREVCRRGGGRVFAANGSEITRLTETDYDKRVLRVRFRAD